MTGVVVTVRLVTFWNLKVAFAKAERFEAVQFVKAVEGVQPQSPVEA
jgi:hypothetical protein